MSILSLSLTSLAQSRAEALLSEVQVASPCDVAWSDMTGSDRIRHCAQCQKHVYDLSRLTAVAAVSLIQEHQGNVCVRFWRREDGTMLTADCPVGVRRQVRRRRQRMATSMAAALVLAFLAATPRPPKPRKRPTDIRGKVACPPSQTMGLVAQPTLKMGEMVASPRLIQGDVAPTTVKQ